MDLELIKEIIAIAVMGILTLALPFGAKHVLDVLGVWARKAKDEIEEWNPHVYDILNFFAVEAVKYAEQAGIGKKGEEKLEMAVTYLQNELDMRGFEEIDIEVLVRKIELAVFEEFNEFKDALG